MTNANCTLFLTGAFYYYEFLETQEI